MVGSIKKAYFVRISMNTTLRQMIIAVLLVFVNFNYNDIYYFYNTCYSCYCYSVTLLIAILTFEP